jgi:hypothetical protein
MDAWTAGFAKLAVGDPNFVTTKTALPGRKPQAAAKAVNARNFCHDIA